MAEFYINGIVSRIESKDYYVFLPGTEITYRCNLPGKFKKQFELKKDKQRILDIVTVGDFVEFELNAYNSGTIVNVNPRKNYISRKAPRIKGASKRGERLEQIICANIDNLVIVTSIVKPEFNNRQLDRFIVCGETAGVNIIIVINKSDLDDKNRIQLYKNLYEKIGYNVVVTSAEKKIGIEQMKKNISGKKSLFWGVSGVGKSSLLNSMYPDLDFKTKEISNWSNKGQHTTVTSFMEKVGENTFIIDSPGVREIEPFGIKKQDLSHYFIDFKDYIHECKFNTCTHYHEPGCAVVNAVEDNLISEERYESYLNMLDSIEEDIIF